jgi:nucleotide-binding universal stress UspA family protein
MANAGKPPVAVGVDGSERSLAAVRLAAVEAALRQRPLRLVHAGDQSTEIEESALDEAAKAAPEVSAGAESIEGGAAAVLIDEARRAELVVVGDGGRGGFAGLPIGSVADQVAARAEAPVLVARGEGRPGGPVVVGVDGSPTSDAAVRFAFAEAQLRGTELLAVHAWHFPTTDEAGDTALPLVYDAGQVEGEADGLLANAIAGPAEQHPTVRVSRALDQTRPAKAVVAASAGAQLVVVGARGRGGFTGLLLGSVSHAVLHHAHSPVAVVRSDP